MAREVQIEALGVTVRLVKRAPKVYALERVDTGETVGRIVRRDSWRVHDWFAEIAVGDFFTNVGEDTLGDCFYLLPHRCKRRKADALAHASIAAEAKDCAARLRAELASGAAFVPWPRPASEL